MATQQPFSLEVNGVEQVKLGITRIGDRVENLHKKVGSKPSLWERWQQSFFAAEIDLFASSGADGRFGKWAPLSPKYAAWKAKHYPGKGIMRQTGKMMRSLVSKGPGHIFKPTSDSLEIGTREKAGWHWEKVGKRPARRVIDIGPQAERQYFGRALAEWGNDLRREWEK